LPCIRSLTKPPFLRGSGFSLGFALALALALADFAYVRLHGPEGRYRGRYGAERLARWAGTFSVWLKEGLDVYCYFDNDEAGYAAQDALELARMMEEV
jgi:uncharacterized protein YecE (DUF72 family)